MSRVLNITNGYSAVAVMKEAGITGDFLPWRDVLHEGPVPGGLCLDALSEIRAEYIAEMGWAPFEQVLASFRSRDMQLQRFAYYKRIVLWFEHDLYDQLQLVQILAWFSRQKLGETQLSLICVDKYLSELPPQELSCLLNEEEPVSKFQLEQAAYAWQALCSGQPELLLSLIKLDTSALPFLKGAVVRLLAEFPNRKNGLSQTENLALELINDGVNQPRELFGAYQDREAARFMGDRIFWGRLARLARCGAIDWSTDIEQAVQLTPYGRELLQGDSKLQDKVVLDRWILGLHLTKGNTWMWDDSSQELSRC